MAGESPYKPPTSHYYCTSNPAPKTRYYTGLFDAPASADIENQNAKAFRQFLSTKYGVNASASCRGSADNNAAAQMQQVITQLKSAKWKIVETGWTPSNTSAAASDASHPDCNSADGWKSVAEYKAACENQPQSGSASSQLAVPSASSSAQPGSGGVTGSNTTPPSNSASAAGTVLAVRMLQAVDSAKDGAGRQYRAVVTKPASGGNGFAIPQGSMATVILAMNQSGWAAHLQSVVVQGQPITVSSGPASVMSSAQAAATGAMNTVSSALSNFGFHKNKQASSVEAVATGDRVILPPGTQLQFVLNSATPVGGAGPGATSMAGMSQPPVANSMDVTNTTAVAAGGTLSAKITEVRLGPSPNKSGGKYVVSRDGGHYAAFAMHGSRELIIVDGVEGPEFDHAGHAYSYGAIDVVFNKDGTHSAYIGQSGDSLVAVVDNKQRATIQQLRPGSGLGQLPGMSDALNYPPTVSNQAPNQQHPILLSPSGQHYACIAYDSNKNVSNMVLDGVKGPDMMSIDPNQIAFVNEELVYVGITPDRNAHIVVNNKIGPEYGTLLGMLVTPDAKHYAVIATTKGGRMVVVDGKPGTLRQFEGNGIHDMVMASNGRVAFVGDTPLGGGISHVAPTLYVDDREISRDIRPFATAVYGNNIQSYVVFSPDGTKFAYSKVVPGGVAAVIDGKVWRTYDGIGRTEFSPDSKHALSVGTRGQSFVTVDGKEMPGINRLDNFIFSPDGTRFAYEAYSQDGNHVVIDGKESPRYYNIIARSLSFSPDSKHYIYGACTNLMKCEVVQDGNVSNVPGLSAFSARTLRPVYIFPPAFFSPDSNQVAYAYSKSDGTSQTVYFVNGKEMVHGTSFEFPSFSPDSKHFVVMGWNGHGYSFFADGKMGPGYQELLEANLNIARFEKPETYRFLGIKDDGVYRVTVDLAATN